MSWGYKIIILYVLFVTGIVFLVVKSSSQNQDLVTTDYYEQELKFQDKIDQENRANGLSGPVEFEIQKENLVISFPVEMRDKLVEADIELYCTADKNRDVKRKLNSSNGQILFPIPVANKGLHELKINWTVNGTSYYYQHKLLIP